MASQASGDDLGSLMNGETRDARRRLNRLNLAILLGFGLVAVVLIYWSVIRGASILGRDDNPRLVESELRVQRGSILDANNTPMAITTGGRADLQREYPLPSAAPVIGYYSLRHGTAGIEEALDDQLRGASADFWSEFWRSDLLGEPQIGRDVRLTLDSRWQANADELLGERNGGVFLFSLPDVSVRAMASRPGYDANRLDDEFERLVIDEQAPLVNRVTQGQYQPGLLLQPFLLAIGQRDGQLELYGTAAGTKQEVVIDGFSLICQGVASEPPTWATAMVARCPGPMIGLAEKMGEAGLLKAIDEFGLLSQPELPIITEDIGSTEIQDAGLAAIGQDSAAVSPLQVGLALAALANDGQFRQAQMILAKQDVAGNWLTEPVQGKRRQVVPAEIAAEILSLFSEADGISEHEIVVLSGPEGNINNWYLGLAPATHPRYGVVVVVEDDEDSSFAQTVGRELLKEVLNSNA
ncbi:MAG: hypothetical protein JSW55_17955 [Chloroflexota bacterium]|nr:MAG: hypothetical protein JSW55_17955 [Chloroflexota bacterium]